MPSCAGPSYHFCPSASPSDSCSWCSPLLRTRFRCHFRPITAQRDTRMSRVTRPHWKQKKRRGWDSNPRYLLGTHALQACRFVHSRTSPGAKALICLHRAVSNCNHQRDCRFSHETPLDTPPKKGGYSGRTGLDGRFPRLFSVRPESRPGGDAGLKVP